MIVRPLFHLLLQHSSTIKLLSIKCSTRPAVADSASVGLHGDGCCEPLCWVASCSSLSQSAPSKPQGPPAVFQGRSRCLCWTRDSGLVPVTRGTSLQGKCSYYGSSLLCSCPHTACKTSH